jgi:hypothetical protein
MRVLKVSLAVIWITGALLMRCPKRNQAVQVCMSLNASPAAWTLHVIVVIPSWMRMLHVLTQAQCLPCIVLNWSGLFAGSWTLFQLRHGIKGGFYILIEATRSCLLGLMATLSMLGCASLGWNCYTSRKDKALLAMNIDRLQQQELLPIQLYSVLVGNINDQTVIAVFL